MLAAMSKPFPGDAILRRADLPDIVVEHLDVMARDFSDHTGRGLFANIVFGFLDLTPFRFLCPSNSPGSRSFFREAIFLAALQWDMFVTPCIYVMLMSSVFKPYPTAGACPNIHDSFLLFLALLRHHLQQLHIPGILCFGCSRPSRA